VGREDDVELLNNQMMEILGGHLVEFCSQERNTLINEVAPRLQVCVCLTPTQRFSLQMSGAALRRLVLPHG